MQFSNNIYQFHPNNVEHVQLNLYGNIEMLKLCSLIKNV